MNDRRQQQSATMFAILAALEAINADAAVGKLPSLTEYQIEPLKNLMPLESEMPATFALADLFAQGISEPNLVLVEKINALKELSKSEIEKYVAEYHDLYHENPPAFAEDIADAEALIPDPIEEVAKVDEVVLPGLEAGPIKAADWSIDMNEKGQLEINTDGMLPATEIDPRTSTYKSENEVLQQALDVVAVIDSAASPIRTGIAEDAYNKTIEGLNDGRQP